MSEDILNNNEPQSKLPLLGVNCHLQSFICLDPGPPLNADDFWRASQLSNSETNQTTDDLMRLPQLERLGEETVKNLNKKHRNILAPLA